MLINLKKEATNTDKKSHAFILEDRLPYFLNGECIPVQSQFEVKKERGYFLLTLKVQADLVILCQRCLHQFDYCYNNKTELAICSSDEIAKKLMDHYECIVGTDYKVDLNELVIDELHLYAPQMHFQISDCDVEVKKFITKDHQS